MGQRLTKFMNNQIENTPEPGSDEEMLALGFVKEVIPDQDVVVLELFNKNGIDNWVNEASFWKKYMEDGRLDVLKKVLDYLLKDTVYRCEITQEVKTKTIWHKKKDSK